MTAVRGYQQQISESSNSYKILQSFPWPSTTYVIFHDSPGLENGLTKLHEFQRQGDTVMTIIPCAAGSCGIVPYLLWSSRAVNATLTRCHWATNASWWRHDEHMSCSVFHRDGEGKQCAQDKTQTSNSTFSTRSQSRLPMESISKIHTHRQQYNTEFKSCCLLYARAM